MPLMSPSEYGSAILRPAGGEFTERTVEPYHLCNIIGDWYLIAFDKMRKEFRNFLVARIEEWKKSPEKFQRDLKFSVSDWMGGAFQADRSGELTEISIQINPLTARYIRERIWHSSQRIDEIPDGSLILHISTGGLSEVKRWILQYGSGMEILFPESLRERVRAEIKSMLMLY